MSVSRWLQRLFLKLQASKSPVEEDVVNIGLVSVSTDEILSFMGKRWRMHQLYYSDSELWCNFRVFSKFETDDWGVMQVFIRVVGRSRLPVRGGCGWTVGSKTCVFTRWVVGTEPTGLWYARKYCCCSVMLAIYLLFAAKPSLLCLIGSSIKYDAGISFACRLRISSSYFWVCT